MNSMADGSADRQATDVENICTMKTYGSVNESDDQYERGFVDDGGILQAIWQFA